MVQMSAYGLLSRVCSRNIVTSRLLSLPQAARHFSTNESNNPTTAPNKSAHHEDHKVAPDMLLKSKRVKGFGRKITLRAINRNIVRRLAKRATIGIPLLGMYFALRVLYNDSKQAFNDENAPFIRKAYATAATIDVTDVAAQSVIIASMTSSFFFSDFNLFPTLAELTPLADKVSLSCALVSSSIGTYCEIKKEEAAELKAEQQQQQQQQQQASSAPQGVDSKHAQ